MKKPSSQNSIFTRKKKPIPSGHNTDKKTDRIFVSKPLFKKKTAQRFSDTPFVEKPLFEKQPPSQSAPEIQPKSPVTTSPWKAYYRAVDRLTNSRRYRKLPSDSHRLIMEKELDLKWLPKLELKENETQENRDKKISDFQEILSNAKEEIVKEKSSKPSVFSRTMKGLKSALKSKSHSRKNSVASPPQTLNKGEQRYNRLIEIYEEIYGLPREKFMD